MTRSEERYRMFWELLQISQCFPLITTEEETDATSEEKTQNKKSCWKVCWSSVLRTTKSTTLIFLLWFGVTDGQQSFQKRRMRVMVGGVPRIRIHVSKVLYVDLDQSSFQLLSISKFLGKAISLSSRMWVILKIFLWNNKPQIQTCETEHSCRSPVRGQLDSTGIGRTESAQWWSVECWSQSSGTSSPSVTIFQRGRSRQTAASLLWAEAWLCDSSANVPIHVPRRWLSLEGSSVWEECRTERFSCSWRTHKSTHCWNSL